MSEQINKIMTDEALNSFDAIGEAIRQIEKGVNPIGALFEISEDGIKEFEGFNILSNEQLNCLRESMNIANRVIITANEIVWHSIPRRSKTKRNRITPKMAFGKSLTRHMRYNYVSARGINRLNRLVK